MYLVGSMEVLEAAAYASFVVGAVFAIWQLHEMRRDRRTQLVLQAMTHYTTREFEDAMCKLTRADASDAKELEKQVSYVDLYMITDFHWAIAHLGLQGLMDTRTLTGFFAFSFVWNKIKPWIIAERTAIGMSNAYADIEKMAQMQEKDERFLSQWGRSP